jgi:hypothetical protein
VWPVKHRDADVALTMLWFSRLFLAIVHGQITPSELEQRMVDLDGVL